MSGGAIGQADPSSLAGTPALPRRFDFGPPGGCNRGVAVAVDDLEIRCHQASDVALGRRRSTNDTGLRVNDWAGVVPSPRPKGYEDRCCSHGSEDGQPKRLRQSPAGPFPPGQ